MGFDLKKKTEEFAEIFLSNNQLANKGHTCYIRNTVVSLISNAFKLTEGKRKKICDLIEFFKSAVEFKADENKFKKKISTYYQEEFFTAEKNGSEEQIKMIEKVKEACLEVYFILTINEEHLTYKFHWIINGRDEDFRANLFKFAQGMLGATLGKLEEAVQRRSLEKSQSKTFFKAKETLFSREQKALQASIKRLALSNKPTSGRHSTPS